MPRTYQSAPTRADAVTISLEEVRGRIGEGLLAVAAGIGLEVMTAMMDDDVAGLAGPKGKHDPARRAVRHGSGPGSVLLGGRRVAVTRPRVRGVDGAGELPLASYEAFNAGDLLGAQVLETMLAGVSARAYPRTLEPVGVDGKATSKSAVSRRVVAATSEALGKVMNADLSHLVLPVIMIDGIHFGEHLCVAALGIDVEGSKHPLALVEGSTENTTLVKGLLVGLRERGLDVTRPVLVVVDGSKALAAGVKQVFDHPVIQRCQVHKRRNVTDHLPDKLRDVVDARMRAAYACPTVLEAEAALGVLAKELDKTHPGAAASLREGMPDTLTVLRLGLDPTLARSLRSTNAIESMNAMARDTCANVTNWSSGGMALRWLATAMLDAQPRWHHVKGHKHLPQLVAALAKTASPTSYAHLPETDPDGPARADAIQVPR